MSRIVKELSHVFHSLAIPRRDTLWDSGASRTVSVYPPIEERTPQVHRRT